MRIRSLAIAPAVVSGLVIGVAALGAQSNPVQTHVAHVASQFSGTPDNQGLLPTAMAEARIAAQHAALAAKAPDNLNAMKLHAGHVLHAIDPSLEPKGPGLGYGVKRAAEGVAQHIQLAAKGEGASAAVKTHATHVATAAESVAARAAQAAAIAQKIRAAETAAQAAPLVIELSTLSQQLIDGADANGDGRITWEKGEGGLNQAQQHLELLQKGN